MPGVTSRSSLNSLFTRLFDFLVAIRNTLLERGDALANFAHQRRNLAAPKQHKHHNRDQKKPRKADIVQHSFSPIARATPAAIRNFVNLSKRFGARLKDGMQGIDAEMGIIAEIRSSPET